MKMPLMVDVKEKRVLIIGGGKIGYRKAIKFANYGAIVTLLSITFIEEILNDTRIERVYGKYDLTKLDHAFYVVAATDSNKINNIIYKDCKNKNIMCMTVDKKNQSDFSFMATAKKDQLIIGVSTQGASPKFSKKLVREIMEDITEEKMQKLHKMMKKHKTV